MTPGPVTLELATDPFDRSLVLDFSFFVGADTFSGVTRLTLGVSTVSTMAPAPADSVMTPEGSLLPIKVRRLIADTCFGGVLRGDGDTDDGGGGRARDATPGLSSLVRVSRITIFVSSGCTLAERCATWARMATDRRAKLSTLRALVTSGFRP